MTVTRNIVDAHTHFSGVLYPRSQEERSLWYGAEEMLSSMNSWGISRSVVSNIEPMRLYQWSSQEGKSDNATQYGGNEKIAEAVVSCPDRLVGSYVPNVFESPRVIKAGIRRFVKEYGFRQIKLHPWLSGFPANAAELNPVFEVASELGIPILYHSGTIPYTNPAQMFDMAMKYPDVVVIMGHAGKGDLCYDALAVARYADNLYMDTSGQPNKVFLERCVAELGSERILFASDWLGSLGKLPFRRLEVEALDISEDAKTDILQTNAERIFCLGDLI